MILQLLENASEYHLNRARYNTIQMRLLTMFWITKSTNRQLLLYVQRTTDEHECTGNILKLLYLCLRAFVDPKL